MKKVLIGIICLLLLALCIIVLLKGLEIGNIKIESIKEIKEKSTELNEDLEVANEKTKKEYPSEVDKLTAAIKTLNTNKEEYENKTAGAQGVEGIGITQIKTYKVEFLWTIIGNYANKEGVTLTLDISKTKVSDVYNLNFTLVGSYIGITDFIYDIENDEDLKFEIDNFSISAAVAETTTQSTSSKSNKTNTNTSTTTSKSDGRTLKATFVVTDISIELN